MQPLTPLRCVRGSERKRCVHGSDVSGGVLEQPAAHHPVALEQLLNSLVKGTLGLESGLAQSLVGNDVVALIRILSDCREMDVKLGYVMLDLQGQFFFGEVGAVQTQIVRLAGHARRVGDGVEHTVGHIAYMNIIAFEVFFKDDDVSFCQGSVDKVVDEQIEAHARRHTEHGRQTEGDDIGTVQQMLLRLHLGAAVERDRFQRRVFGAEGGAVGDTVTAIRVRIDYQLVRAAEAVEQTDGIKIHGRGQLRIAVTGRSANDAGQVNDYVGVFDG